MSIRVPWNKYEAALLVEAFVRVREGVIQRDEAIHCLSELLRAYGEANNVEVDDVYRNINGISMRMAEIERLFNDGVGGLKNTSKLFVETVVLFNTDKDQFDLVLEEAKRVTGQKKSNKESFFEWLKLQPKLKLPPDRIISLLDEGSTYAVAHKMSRASFWDIDNAKEFVSSCNKLLGARLYRMLHRSTAVALDKCYAYYKDYLTERTLELGQSTTPITSRVSPVTTSSKPEKVESYEQDCTDSQKETSIGELGEVTPRTTINEGITIVLRDLDTIENKLFALLKSISDSNTYGTTLYYLANSIKAPEREIKKILDEAEWASLKYGRYSFNYNAVQGEVHYNFEKPQSLACSKPISASYFEETVIKAESWRQLFVDLLKVIYEDYPHCFKEFCDNETGGNRILFVGGKNDAVNMKAPIEFAEDVYVETNKPAREIMACLKVILDSCSIDYENVPIVFKWMLEESEKPENKQDKTRKSDIRTNSITIVEAASVVLQKADKPLTIQEIYNQIISEGLYTFGSADPVHVVEVNVNTACRGSSYTYRTAQELFGFIDKNGKKLFYLLSREKEMMKREEQIITTSIANASPVRTETDKKLLEKYPVLFKRIYTSMKEYGNITVTAQNVHEKTGKISRLSTVKRILDYASWCEHKGENYKYSATPIIYELPDDQLHLQPSISGENDFYHWLETAKEFSSSDCGRYTSGINVLSRFLNNECAVTVDLYKVQDLEILSNYLGIVEEHPSFVALAENQRYRLSSSLRLYMEYLAALEGTKSKVATAAAKTKEKEFRQWAALRIGPEKARSHADILKFIEDRCIDNQLLRKPFFELDKDSDFSAIMECIQKRKFPFTLQNANLTEAIEAIPIYITFLHKDDVVVKPPVLPKNVKVLDFKDTGDLAFTKPVRLKFCDQESFDFNSWADLYAKLLYMLRIDHPRILSDGASLSGSVSPDISTNSGSMRAPKIIGKNLYVETNHDTKGLVNRMAEALSLCGVSLKKVEIQYLVREKTISSAGSKKIAVDSQQMSRLMAYVKRFDSGISLKEIRTEFPEIKSGVLKAMLDTDNIIIMNDKYYHRGNIEDFDEAADIILSTIQSQFQREGGYTSAKMVYDELHIRLEDFFFDNGKFDSQIELYDLARYLFEKVKYKGFTFVFADNKHIWKEEPDYPKTYLGILSHWAKKQNSLMTRDEILERLVSIGSNSPQATFSWLMLAENQNPREKTFLMYDEYRYVLTEACHIDDAFLSHLRMSLEELFEGDDYLAMDDIDEYFYTTLPDLPTGAVWSPHMLKSVLAFYDVGFSTVAVGGDNDIKVPDAAIVRKSSIYKSFSDVLWSEINRDYDLPREFSAEEFRQILLKKGFIHGLEKLYSVHSTVNGDLRFYWTENNSIVTVSKK